MAERLGRLDLLRYAEFRIVFANNFLCIAYVGSNRSERHTSLQQASTECMAETMRVRVDAEGFAILSHQLFSDLK